MRALFLLAALISSACGLGRPEVIPVPPPRTSQHAPGLQTHFGAPIGPATLAAVQGFGYAWARIDAQATTIAATLAMIEETQAAGLRPLVIVWDAAQMLSLPSGIDYELRNEPDLNGPSPSEYGILVASAANASRVKAQRLWVGSISNLNGRGFSYLEKIIKQVPDDIGISVHRYGDGAFDPPHDGFASREQEVHKLLNMIGARHFAVTEFGYPTGWISDVEQATRISQEFAFWARMGAAFSILFQINDGSHADERYGIRRVDGTWKPSAWRVGVVQ